MVMGMTLLICLVTENTAAVLVIGADAEQVQNVRLKYHKKYHTNIRKGLIVKLIFKNLSWKLVFAKIPQLATTKLWKLNTTFLSKK